MNYKPEYHTHEEFINRSKKLEELKELGIEPYPHQFHPTHHAESMQKEFGNQSIGSSEDAASGETVPVIFAGRLVLFRAMGKNAFAHLQDSTGRVQVMFNRDLTVLEGYTPTGDQPTQPLKIIEKKFDLGDFVGVEGDLFHTQKGELTIYVKKATLLSKSLLPLAEKHSGLADKETRYRKRWLDLISNQEVCDTFRKRSQILRIIRAFFEDQNFLEVETPVLQSIYGGAEARPFKTVLNALEQEMFMRISLEIPLKKLIVGGFEKVFEIGRVYRNEGIDRNHNPEFTLLEAYAAYWDYNDMMALMEKLVETLAMKLYDTTILPVHNPHTEEVIELNVKAPWPRFTMKEAIKKFGEIDVDTLSDDELYTRLKESGHVAEDRLKLLSRGLMIAALFEVFAEPKLIQPHHIIDHPQDTTPLCKLHRNEKERSECIVERFESFILGGEICNAYSELNDPILQRKLLEKQAKRLEQGDEEASPLDEEFVEAICQGMPPTGGIGIGIDRLIMLLTDSHSIRDVLLFPWMKPLSHTDSQD
ncbi:MAG: lysine--tRNA ligase [Waddliaceae bacterium]